MCSMKWDNRNFARASEENGCLFSVISLFWGPYWEIRFCTDGVSCSWRCLVCEKVLTEGISDKEIFFVVCEKVCCKVLPGGVWYISKEHWLDCLFGFILDTDLASIDVIGNVGIHSVQVVISLGQVSLPFLCLCGYCVGCQCSLIEHWGYPFRKIFSLVSSSLVPQKWHVMQGTSWDFFGQPLRVYQYTVLCMGSLSKAPLIMFNLSAVKCILWMLWCSCISMFLFMMGISWGSLQRPFLFLAYIELYNHTSLDVIAFFVDGVAAWMGFFYITLSGLW